MSFDLTAGIVRILLGPNKGTAGTGFVVNEEGLVVTCAHVVKDAHAGPGDIVFLIFHAANDKGKKEATVLPEKYWRASDAEDVAFLRLEEEKLPEGVKHLPLGRYGGKNNFSTFGFPGEALTSGRWGTGSVLGRPQKMMGFFRLQLRSEEITKGFSGAPVWDDELQCVIGMVDAIRQGRSITLGEQELSLPIDPHGRFQYEAFATPTETLWEIYPDIRPSDQCPYLSLEKFTKDDSLYFCGRERVVEELVKNLKDEEPQFLAVLGPSGCGKSSLVQAGLLPCLEKEPFPGTNQWDITITRPTNFKFDEFKSTISSLQRKPQHIGLVIDQFEELFWAYSEEQCQEILNLLKDLLEQSSRFHLILTMRNEYYSHLFQFEGLEKWLKKGIVNVPSTLRSEEIRDIIQKPAKIARLNFDDGLVEIIVNDVLKIRPPSGSEESGALNTVLPLLEFTLAELWERRNRNQGKLTLDAYRRIIGGVTGGIKECANKKYNELGPREQELARRIFIQLIHVNKESLPNPYSCQRRQKGDLVRTISGEQGMIEQVIQQLVNARLLVTDQPSENATIELSHEVLIREWPVLKGLLPEARKIPLFQQSLSEDVEEWEKWKEERKGKEKEKRKQPRDLLYRGDKLKQAKEWIRHNVPDEQTAAFIRASATQQTLSIIRVLAVVLLLVPSLGFIGWYFGFQPNKTLVTTLKDNNEVGSLRWCIDNAPLGSTITFDRSVRGIIELTGGDLLFSGDKRLTIEGPGANQLTITGGNRNVIIHISKGATLDFSGLSFKNSITTINAFLFNEGTLKLTNSIISNNKTNGFFFNQATSGIENKGTLTVIDSTISNNTSIGFSTLGSGIYSEGQLTVNRSIISNNSSHTTVGAGGGIYNRAGTAVVTDSTFSNNVVSDEESTTNVNGFLMGGGIYNSGKLTVTNSKFSNNQAIGISAVGRGGGITNSTSGILMVTGSTFSENIAKSTTTNSQGGGIDNGGKLTVTNSKFSNNQAISSSGVGFAGGIANNDKGILMVISSTFSGNIAKSDTKNGQGGGIDNAGKLTVKDSTFSNNSASGSQYATAGGINNFTSGILMVTGSTFSGNIAKSDKQTSRGGGMYNAGKLTVANSTFSNNKAVSSSVQSFGGGIFSWGHEGSYTIIRFCTIYENSSNVGGGIWDDPAGSSHLTISSSIIAHNSADDGPDILGTVISEGYNLIENVIGAKGLNTRTDKQVKLADLKIEPTLGKHGGPTQTLALLQGSQAIGIVPLQACRISITDVSGLTVTITTDQRGERRPGGSKEMCDTGAYESSY
jgi:energy-coupling factor transporter ATP-binding protein EcfA2